ncbi:hypothetical protein GN958_ATG03286 [Phytophthora infestans]|uniref:Uncharacterized protein n=1 Tax=Phytophthora infestans TaxID=4787 RepID=A0A8S9V243_PHYIN|nr:hypothetical protein GN958_ATG03286 [Phytophthora infestans]
MVSKYFRQFNYYLSSPGTSNKVAFNCLHEIMALDVMDGTLFGIDAQLESWSLLAFYFDGVRLGLKGLKVAAPGTLAAGTVTTFTITAKSLRRAYPHLNSDGAGGAKGGV